MPSPTERTSRPARHLLAQLTAAILLGACSQPRPDRAAPTPESAALAPEKEKPAERSSRPKGWNSDNVFLGRWQGNSTAGRAVLDVLSVEPKRVRWGNAANGVCDSDYSVEQLPSEPNGRFPDQLIAPTAPTDLVYAVVRLTLEPDPCSTGVAVIQLAKPLDGSDTLQVVTYDTKGAVRGQYPDLSALGREQATNAQWPQGCTINDIASSCRTEPAAKNGFTIYFSHAKQPFFTFTPVGAPTTDRREMVDGSGQRWAMSGNQSFELEEIGGNGNRITVSSP